MEDLRRTHHILDSQLTATGQDLIQTQKVMPSNLFPRRKKDLLFAGVG